MTMRIRSSSASVRLREPDSDMTGHQELLRHRPRLVGAARRVRRAVAPRVTTGSVGLLYHPAAQDSVDPRRLAVQPQHLSQHLEILAAHTLPSTAAGLRLVQDSGRILPPTPLVSVDD